ncbi:MAG TPA: hypothetical protein DE315_02820 [Candidatus Omnitrophica bacterium]|nr:MAG: hypothetical protein A2Y05_00230 [Omnitrophica WOR_2 bacterium GWA2_53_43]HBO98042.1 hypothetical protein [Candidatus Omnitrophota bacterium]HCI44453.1 hypothetical protein [Candidatus Omnitrophota bacterium]
MSGYDETRNSKGQSTIEYILVVAAVIAAMLIFAGSNGIFQNTLNAIYDTDINSMVNMAERILE